MKTVSTGAARRYARALLDVAQAQGDPAAVRAELGGVLDAVERHRELRSLLLHPALSPERKKALVAAVFGAGALSELLLRLLALLAERGRMALLPAIARSYAEQWNARRGVALAELASAAPLSDDETRRLAAALQAHTGLGIEIASRSDPQLLGGVLVRIGGQVYDGTLRGRLRALRERLLGREGSL